jgi:hypothetical protein
MIKVEMSEQEWSQIISIIAASHPLVMKISQQVVAYKMEKVNAAKGNGVGPDTRTDPSWVQTAQSPANSGHSPEQRAEGPIPPWPPKPE